MLVYVDTSAMVKRIAEESESDVLDQHLAEVVARGDRLIASVLLDIELSRVAVRDEVDQEQVDAVLGDVKLVGIFPEVIESAKSIEQTLKALDAIHIGTALLLADEAEGEEAVEQIVTYDTRMRTVAEELGFEVVSPGQISPGRP